MRERILQALRRRSNDEPEGNLPPIALALAGVLEATPPEKLFEEERFRVAVYLAKDQPCDDCGRDTRYVTMEFLHDGEWNHLLTVHEVKLNLVKAAIDDAIAYLTELSEDALSAV